ncbi:MAG: enolase C-terminal domain-like protein [Woeseiaceae bacterium]|nr:enolase C-terminal domain-like protein [Woeseiaceae bacterium]
MWDLEAKRSGRSIWSLTGIEPQPVTTVYTIGLEDTPEEMAARASAAREYPLLKVKLDGHRPLRAPGRRYAAPGPTPASSWTPTRAGVSSGCRRCCPVSRSSRSTWSSSRCRGAPTRRSTGFDSPVPLAADESCQDSSELEIAARRYDMINIKLDKTGGLTEALALARQARDRGCRLMVGNMLGTSLSMAPSFVVAQLCDFVDIDGPLLMRHDREFGMHYNNAVVEVFDSRLWG